MARKASERPTALVTGGAKGMGRAITLALAEDGYDIGIVTRKSEAAARSVCAQCEKLGVRAAYWKADLTDVDTTEEIARDFVREYRRWDVLINNIGDYWSGPILSMKTDTLREMFQSNFSAAARLSLLATKIMRMHRQGRIVNIGWVFADRLQGIPDTAAYHAAKTALLSFTSSLAKVAMVDGITINTVSPGMHYTSVDLPKDVRKVIPAGRFSSDEDIVGAIRYFLSPHAAYVTGSNIKVSGGYGV
ncbi:MAG TPA: SDR family NAD(P)-dependent oxidoreductase [bacterium]|nr:SDR family NAD(P)-dependent oxidoreductase [bacterium]